ncbi:hypothetical protein [Streptomyces sp. KL116D]|uniref:hypothetical protein n=1 Tax=Streptomyces sp. KL116D TaxID=3045152 RepID=UPI003555C450
MSGINRPETRTGDILDEHGYPSPALPPNPDGAAPVVRGEYGGLGLTRSRLVCAAVVRGRDPATYTDDYLTKLDEVHKKLACAATAPPTQTRRGG